MSSIDERLNTRHVDILDGCRGLAVLIVVWYHAWQQSWLIPTFNTPWLSFLGIRTISVDFIPRSGYLFVDFMLLLSAFCLFLPHARAALLNEPVPSISEFYRKRLVRIVPSYYLCVFIIFFGFCIPGSEYAGIREAVKDLSATLTFTQVLFPSTYLGTKINGVLWTAAVEVQFYLIFPALAAFFRRKPFLAWTLLFLTGELYLWFIRSYCTDTMRLLVNQLPGFFSVFANGMALAYVYVLLSGRVERKLSVSLPATLLLPCFCMLLCNILKNAGSAPNVQVYQSEIRFFLSLIFCGIILMLALSFGAIRFIFSNKLAAFLGSISYNLYIWHQWLMVKFKQWHIPYWEGEIPPNQAGNRTWQLQYFFLCIAASVFIASVVTYTFEKPLTRNLSNGKISLTKGLDKKKRNNQDKGDLT